MRKNTSNVHSLSKEFKNTDRFTSFTIRFIWVKGTPEEVANLASQEDSLRQCQGVNWLFEGCRLRGLCTNRASYSLFYHEIFRDSTARAY
ncbi:MAG: hypothetical protein O7C39_08860 [Bacteroidetes bacterium]|nr:hypothetical protein [Bacteroidota bacterium]